MIKYEESSKCKKLKDFNKVETKMFNEKGEPEESVIHGEESPVLE